MQVLAGKVLCQVCTVSEVHVVKLIEHLKHVLGHFCMSTAGQGDQRRENLMKTSSLEAQAVVAMSMQGVTTANLHAYLHG